MRQKEINKMVLKEIIGDHKEYNEKKEKEKKLNLEKMRNQAEIDYSSNLANMKYSIKPENIDYSNYLFVPVNSNFGDRPIYVNPKQYTAILKRRMKKIHKKLKSTAVLIKHKIKYVKRSKHAKNRKRDKNGKFIKKKKDVVVKKEGS